MPGILRLGDRCSGHGPCWEPRKNTEGSQDVFADGLPVHRLGDRWETHGTGDCDSHDGKLASGSESVLTNGLPTGRIGDSVNCGSVAVTGSETIIIN